PQPLDGLYEFRLSSSVRDVSGNLMNPDSYTSEITVDRQPLRIVSQSPSTSINGALEALTVKFNVPILESSFSPGDVRISGPGGNIAITDVERIDATTYRIRTERATEDGVYEIFVGPNVTDASGVAMDSDGDAVAGELEDRYVGSLQVTGGGPFVDTFSPSSVVTPGIDFVDVKFSEPVRLSSFSPEDVTISGPNGMVAATQIESLGGRDYRVRFAAQSTGGTYAVTIGPNIDDFGGLPMDQDRDGIAGEAGDDVFASSFQIDSGGPVVTSISPDFVSRPYSFVEVFFDEAIDPASLAIDDISLIGPDGEVTISQVVTSGTDKINVLFAQQSTIGTYTLTVGPGITDASGNEMDQDGDGIFGEASEDQFNGSIVFATPDLEITDSQIADSASNGDGITVSFTVTNNGAAIAAASWLDRVVLSTDEIYGNADDVLLGTASTTDDLPIGASYEATIDISIPFGIEGDYHILARTNHNGGVYEDVVSNNTLIHDIEVLNAPPPADLIVDAITVPEDGFIGDTVEITYRVRNDGTATTTANNWIDRVYLSSDTDFGEDIFLGNVIHNGTLDSNASYTRDAAFVVPTSVAVGNYFVIVQTDATNRVSEPTAEDNNITSSNDAITIATAPLPDLVASSVAIADPAAAISGETVIATWTTINDGENPAKSPWAETVYLSQDDVLSPDDIQWGRVIAEADLAVDQSVNRSLSGVLPEGISGDYYFIVVVDSDNEVNEGDGEDTPPAISDAFDVSLFPYADLTVAQLDAPELLVGDPVDLTVSWAIENVGDGPGRVSSWTDRVVLSRDDVLGNADDMMLGNFPHDGGAPAGSQYSRTEVFPLPARTNGRFHLFVQTDVDDVVFEVDGHASNLTSRIVDISTTPFSDLVVDSVSVAGTARSGQNIDVTWSVRNNADRAIGITDRDSWTDFIYVSDDPTGQSNLRLVGSSIRGGALDIGDSYVRTQSVTLPRDADGDYYAFVRTGGPNEFLYDSLQPVDQGGGGNQAISDAFPVEFIPPPDVDLVVSEVSLGGATEFLDGQQVEVTWTVLNQGETSETGWRDRLVLRSTNGDYTRSFGEYVRADALESGKSYTRTEVITLPREIGQFEFTVEADVRGTVFETNNDNNLGVSDAFSLNLRPRPDLRVEVDTEYPQAVTAGGVIDVRFTVRNLGTADTPSGGSRWNDRVYLSSSSSSVSGAILLGEIGNGSALGFNGSTGGLATEYATEASFAIPRAISGNWFVVVQTDARSQVDEYPNDGNNIAAQAIAIDANPVPPPDLVATSIQGPGDTFDDSSITVRYKVENRGVGPTDPGSWTDQIWLTLGEDGPKPGRGDRYLGAANHQGVLEVGESYEAEVTVNIPTGLTGQYFLTVYTDGTRRVYEAAFAENVNPNAPNDLDGNNYASTRLNVLLTPPADLRVAEVITPRDDQGNPLPIVGDETITVAWTVDNIGAVATDRERWADAIYLSEDDEFSSDDTLVFALPHDGRLQPGQSYTTEATFTLPPTAKGQHLFIQTNVDPRIALTDEAEFLDEVKAVLSRIEEATGKPLGEVMLSDLNQFTQTELRAILAGPTNRLETVYEGPFGDNNVGRGEVDVRDKLADLTVTSVVADATSVSGEPLDVRWTVENVGDFATADRTVEVAQYIYLSKDEVFDASRAVYAGAQRHTLQSTLGPGETFNDRITVATPPGSEGRWYAHVFVNVAINRFRHPVLNTWSPSRWPQWIDSLADKPWEDGVKDNNFAVSNPIEVTYAEADLQITSLSAVPQAPDSGALVDVRYTVSNLGTRATRTDRWTDRLFISADTSLDAYDIEVGQYSHRDGLVIGGTYDAEVSVRMPNNIGGEYHLIVMTDSTFATGGFGRPRAYPEAAGPTRLRPASDQVAEFQGEGNNVGSQSLDVQFVPAPDLTLDSLTHTDRVEIGQDFQVSYVWANDGGAVPPSQTPFNDRIYLSRDRFLDPSADHYVSQVRRNEAPAAGSSGTIDLDLRLPRGLVGDYYVIVTTDIPAASRPDGEVIETDEDDNVRVSDLPMLIVAPPPSDLQITSILASASSQVGDIATASWTVENQGDVVARARIADAVYLSADNVWDIGDKLLGQVEADFVRTLQPGQSYSAELNFEIPPVLPGDYRIIVRTDIFDDVVEGENNRNNTLPSPDAVSVTVPTLRLDVPLSEQLATGVSRLFELPTEPGQTIRVALDSINDVGSHELYAAHERLPTSFDNDAAYQGYLRPDQNLLIPETLGGNYYVLARAGVRTDLTDERDPRARQEYPVRMSASRIPFGITRVTPDSGGDDRYVTMTINGAEFPPQAAVRLVRPTLAEIAPVSVTRVDATRIIAVFDLRDAPHGLYDVQVLHPDGRVAVQPYRFQVESADPLAVNVGVGGPGQIDLGSTGAYGIPVENLSNVDIPYTIIEYAFPNVENNSDLIDGPAIQFETGLRDDLHVIAPLFDSISTFDFGEIEPELNLDGVLTGRAIAIDLPASGVTEIGSLITIYPGLAEKLEEDPDFLNNLLPGQLEDLAFDFYVAAAATPMTSAEYIDYQLGEAERLRQAILADAEAPADFASIAADEVVFGDLFLQSLANLGLLREEDTPPTATPSSDNVNAFFNLIGAMINGDAGQNILADVGTDLVSAGSELRALINKLRGYYGHTEDVFSGGDVGNRDDFDLRLSNPTSFVTYTLRAGPPEELIGEIADELVFDTGDLGSAISPDVFVDGPDGFGEDVDVPIATPLPYSVTATFPAESNQAAQEIRVLVPLDDTLDERSFQLTDIRLGDRTIPLPPGRPSFVGEFDFFQSDGYVLQVTAGVDATSRVASFLIRAVDPRDGLPPASPAIGLLSPGESVRVGYFVAANQTAAAGQDESERAILRTGDVIETTARVTFNDDASLDSDADTVRLDALAPTSSWTVTPISGNRYRVSWTASDDDGGSGVADYSLLVSRDGGTRFRSVLYRTEETEAIYQAGDGETPQFLVRAIDAAGNIEAVAAGIRVPRLVAGINLGGVSPSTIVLPTPLSQAEPETDASVADRLFDEAALGIASRTSASRPAAFTRVLRPLAAERFVTLPGNSGAGIGSLALAVAPSGRVFASGGAGRNELFVITGDVAVRLNGYDRTDPIYDLAFDAAGQLWATTGGLELLQLDPSSGAVLDRIGGGISLGLAAIPGETAMYVSTVSGISRLDTATRTLTPFSDVRVDAMAVAADGTLYATQWPGDERSGNDQSDDAILRIDFRGRAEIIANVEGGAESLAIGPADTIYEGALLVGHEAFGRISVVDPLSLRQVEIAQGAGGRVENIAVLPDGRFLVTSGEQIDRFFTVAAPRVIDTIIRDGGNRAALVFDVGLNAEGEFDEASARTAENYSIRNLETGQLVSIGAVRYDTQSRTSELLFETLAPAEYELTVAPSIESEQGIEIGGNGFATTFRVFEDVSLSTGISFTNTRINRKDGTLQFDVVVHNTADFDIAGPINIFFNDPTAPLPNDGSVVFFGNDGAPANADGFQILGDGTTLAAGTTSAAQTVTFSNPNLVDLSFDARVLASLPANQLPEFDTDPNTGASTGQRYEYQANANDPDGSSVRYVLARGPEGAQVDSATGEVSWQPNVGATADPDFELRAYDSRGGFRRQVWTVDLSGANRAPILADIENVFAREGDLIEIPFSGFDPDGDDLFYFADGLPAGAVLDANSQTLRWRPDGDAAGIYTGISLSTSDGFVETSLTFDIVVANANVAPVLRPVTDRTINEGDTLTFALSAEDADGDSLSYSASLLPPGAFLEPSSGRFTWTPGFNQHGVYEIGFRADDGSSIAEQTMTLTVQNINGQVEFPSIGEFQIFEGQPFALRVAAGDPEFPLAPVDPVVTTDDFFIDYEAFLPELDYQIVGLPDGAVFDPERQLLTWTPAFDATGDDAVRRFEIDFTATDDGDGTGLATSDTVTVTIEVLDANFAPEITAVPNTILAVGESLQLPITAVNPDGGPLSLELQFGQASRLPEYASFVDNGDGTGVLNLTPQPGDRDDVRVTVTARETTGELPLESSTEFILGITSANEPPVMNPVFDSVAVTGQSFVVDLFVSDADQDDLTFSATGLPAGATLTPSSVYGRATLEWTPTASDIGSLDITLSVTDTGNDGIGDVLSDSQSFRITVRDTNVRPELDPIGSQTIVEGQVLTLTPEASDADGDRVSFRAARIEDGSIVSLPSRVDFDPETGRFEFSPGFDDAGDYRFRITATDGFGSRSEDILVNVTET
ncbi:MAG: CARDB domain-containing protein, partial [Planctomycetota bacterium]